MRIPIVVFAFCMMHAVVLKAQPSLSLASGFSTDINGSNTNEKFKHVPFVAEFQLPTGRKGSGILFTLQYYIPLAAWYTANAYTLNPSLPPHIPLQESIQPYIFTASIGFRIPLVTFSNKSRLFIDLFPFCLSNQNTHVKYPQYDKTNYDIENPDYAFNATGLSVSASITHRQPFKKNGGGFVAALSVQSPPATKQNAYANNYKLVTPLQLTVGYYFNFKKSK
jgi:hypothetical protein